MICTLVLILAPYSSWHTYNFLVVKPRVLLTDFFFSLQFILLTVILFILNKFMLQWKIVKPNTDKPNYRLNRANFATESLYYLYNSYRINRKSVKPNNFPRSLGVRFNQVPLYFLFGER